MLHKIMSNSFDGMRGENKFLRIAIVGLIVSNLFVSCSAINRDEIITVVPPTMTEKSWVSKTDSSAEYVDAWAMYIAMLLGNVSPGNAAVVKDAIGPILAPEIYQQVMEVLDKQIYSIRQDRVSLSFEPQKVLRDVENPNKFFVTGRSVTQGPTGDKRRTNRTYEFELVIRDYKPVLKWISTNIGDPRTKDVVEREEAKEQKMREREERLSNG